MLNLFVNGLSVSIRKLILISYKFYKVYRFSFVVHLCRVTCMDAYIKEENHDLIYHPYKFSFNKVPR